MILVDKLFITELGTHYNGYTQGFIIGMLKLFNKDVTYAGTWVKNNNKYISVQSSVTN